MMTTSSALPVVDTHFHVWDLNKFHYSWLTPKAGLEKICKSILPEDYKKEMETTPICNAVFVEAHDSIEETRWMLSEAEDHPFIRGIVGFVDLTSRDLEEEILKLKKSKKFVGVRKILDLSEEKWIERDDVIAAMSVLKRNNLTFDLLIKSRSQFESAKLFLDRAPADLNIVIDHLGKPDAKNGAEQWWYDDITMMAAHPNVLCKLSGMVTEAGGESWEDSNFQPHVDHVVREFGVDRVMFGSDWPVCKVAGANLKEVYQLLCRLLHNFSDDEKRKIFSENAVKFYNLKLN